MSKYRLPPEWESYGARLGNDGLLYLGEWRRGFTVHELRALFWECQQVRALERERREITAALEIARADQEQAEQRAAWYRRQLVAESRLGLMLQAIAR